MFSDPPAAQTSKEVLDRMECNEHCYYVRSYTMQAASIKLWNALI